MNHPGNNSNGTDRSERGPQSSFWARQGPSQEAHLRADLKAYLDGELPALRRWVVRRHLVRCSECREEVTWLKRLGDETRELDKAVPRPELRARILASLPDLPPAHMAGTSEPLTLRSARGGRYRLALGSAVAALAVVGAFALAHNGLRLSRQAPSEAATHPVLLSQGEPGSGAPSRGTPQPGRFVPGPPFPARIADAPSHSVTGRPGRNPENRPVRDPFQPGSAVDSTPTPHVSHPGSAPSGSSDGTYAAAENLFQRRWAEEQARQPYQNPMPGGNGEKAPQKLAHAQAAPPIRLALAVEDVAAARDSIQSLARQMNGSAALNPPASISAWQRGAPQPTADKNTLALRVPADRAAALLQQLSKMGALKAVRPEPNGKNGVVSASKHVMAVPEADRSKQPEEMYRLLLRGYSVAQPGAPSAGNPRSPAFVTVTVQLQPRKRPAPEPGR